MTASTDTTHAEGDGTEPSGTSPAGKRRSYDDMVDRHVAATALAESMGGPAKLVKRKEAGIMNARERVAYILDEGSFVESGKFAASGRPEAKEKTPADGKVVGFGLIEKRPVAVVANDFTVMGASSSQVNGKKIKHIKEVATKRGMPIVFLGESTGARMPDVMGAAGIGAGDNPTQYQRCRESPWVAGVLGHCYGSSAWYTALSDYAVMRRGAILAVSSPKLTSMAIGESVDPEELGGWRVHADGTGLVDEVVRTDEEALQLMKRFLSYLPSNHMLLPPVRADWSAPTGDGRERITEALPLDRSAVYDVHRVLDCIFDDSSVFELKRRFGRSIVTALARVEGRPVGVIANNPFVKGGAIDADACAKATSFIVLCDSFNLPLLFFVDQPGFLIGKEGEKRAVIGKVMNWMNALALCTVPKLSIIMRKTYGQAVLNMGGGGNADEVCAWTTADVSFMDPEYAVSIVHNVKRTDDPDHFDELLAEMSKGTSAYEMAAPYSAHSVILPWETRDYVVRTLAIHQSRFGSGIGSHRMAAWPTTIA